MQHIDLICSGQEVLKQFVTSPIEIHYQGEAVTKRVVVTDHAFKNLKHEEAMAHDLGVTLSVFQCTDELETAAAVRGADVVVTNFAPITRSVLSILAKNATVIRYGIGYDNVDVASATEFGITVANVPDYGVETVANHAAACVLSLTRRLSTYTSLIRSNGWAKPGDVGDLPALSSLTVGFVGFGRIAQALHQRLRVFGFSFVAYDPVTPPTVQNAPDVKSVSLDELARLSNIVSLHAPSNELTKGMIGREFLALVPTGALIINTARGALIDTDALIVSLEEGRVGGAALDVTEPEPLQLHSRLREMPNVILTPHAAFYDDMSIDRLQLMASQEAARALRGEALRSPVNRPTIIQAED